MGVGVVNGEAGATCVYNDGNIEVVFLDGEDGRALQFKSARRCLNVELGTDDGNVVRFAALLKSAAEARGEVSGNRSMGIMWWWLLRIVAGKIEWCSEPLKVDLGKVEVGKGIAVEGVATYHVARTERWGKARYVLLQVKTYSGMIAGARKRMTKVDWFFLTARCVKHLSEDLGSSMPYHLSS